MKGIFCSTTAKNNEEYRKIIQSRMRMLAVLIPVGILTVAAAVFANQFWDLNISDHIRGFYCGVGSGVTLGAIVLWIRGKLLLDNEDKLKEERLRCTDERQVEIGNKAMIASTKALLVALYLVGFIGGIIYPILLKALIGLVILFGLVYAVSVRVYESKM